jgi:hypothetical protein
MTDADGLIESWERYAKRLRVLADRYRVRDEIGRSQAADDECARIVGALRKLAYGWPDAFAAGDGDVYRNICHELADALERGEL